MEITDMSLWLERLNELQRYQAMLKEGEQCRLTRQSLIGRPKNQKAWCRGLSWLGSRLADWGEQLQERYGTATAAPTLSGEHSEG